MILTTVDPGVGGERLTSKRNHDITQKTHNGKNRHIVIINGRPDKQGFYTFTLSL